MQTLRYCFAVVFWCLTIPCSMFAQQKSEQEAQPQKTETATDPIGIFKEQLEDLTSELEKLKESVLENKEKQEEVKRKIESLRSEIDKDRDQALSAVSEKIEGNLKEVTEDIAVFKGQIDTLKGVVQYYYLAEKKIPEIDEEILNVLELPEVRYKVTLKNGTVVVGDILSENLDVIVMQTTIGKLVIEKDFIENYEERFYTGARVELAGDYEIREFPDREEFIGRVKNIGERRADFVKVFFYLWDATTELAGTGSSFVDGMTARFRSGVISNVSIEPGGTVLFHVVVPKQPGKKVAYRTNEIKWRQYE